MSTSQPLGNRLANMMVTWSSGPGRGHHEAGEPGPGQVHYGAGGQGLGQVHQVYYQEP